MARELVTHQGVGEEADLSEDANSLVFQISKYLKKKSSSPRLRQNGRCRWGRAMCVEQNCPVGSAGCRRRGDCPWD
jgi:hypothetical protein